MITFPDWLEAQQSRADEIGDVARLVFSASSTVEFVAMASDEMIVKLRGARVAWNLEMVRTSYSAADVSHVA